MKVDLTKIVGTIGIGILVLMALLLAPQPVFSASNETSTYCNVTVNSVIDTSVSNVPIDFGSLNTGVNDQTPTTGGYPTNVTVHSTTNTGWNLSIKASGDFSGAGTLAIGNLEYGNVSDTVATSMTTSYASPFTNWYNQANPGSDTNRSIYFDLSVPSDQTAGDYSTTLYVNVTGT